MKHLLLILLCAFPLHAQVSFVATIGGHTGYKAPYAEGAVEAKHRFDNVLVFGEMRGASGRKSDTGDGFHFGTRGIAAYRLKGFDLGGGIAYSKQWTSLYQKQAVRPIAYVGWKQLDAFWIFKGSDFRNGQHGLEIRWTEMLSTRWGARFGFLVLRGYQTDRPAEPLTISGADTGAVFEK